MNTVIRATPLFVCLAAPTLLSAAVAHLSGNSPEFYHVLALPRFAPPSPLSGMVWTILYLLMGYASYLIYMRRELSHSDRNSALSLYGFSLLVHFLWSFLFFRFRLFWFSALWMVVVFVVTVLCAGVFHRICRPAGRLMFPVLAWMVFSGVVNVSIAVLN